MLHYANMHGLGMQTSFMNYKCNVQRFFNYHVTAIDTFIKRNIYIMHMHGRPQKFFQGGATSTFRFTFFRLRKMLCKWAFAKRFTLSSSGVTDGGPRG